MIHYVIVIVGIFAFCSAVPSICDGAPSFSVEVKGMRIVADGYGGEEGLRPFAKSKGISLVCFLFMPAGNIIQFDRDTSTIDKFQDNRGTDLPLGNDFTMQSGFGMFFEISKDKKALKFDIGSQHLPKKEATSIIASGTLAIKAASTSETVKHNNVVLKPGTKFKVPGITFTISEAGKPEWGDHPLEVELNSFQDLTAVRSIQFFDPDGTEIESGLAMHGKMEEMDKKITYVAQYALSKHVEHATIVVTYWTDVKELKLPFSIDSSIGL
jgi:hypothetical protein